MKLVSFYLCLLSMQAVSNTLPLMPSPADVSTMGWRDGFPGKVADAPWHRCIHSGHFGFIQDTQSLEILHLGSPNLGETHSPAELDLLIAADGKTYRAMEGVPWSRWYGPRIIVSGRLVQQADVRGLRFIAEDGSKLAIEARLETVAWPDRLALVLHAEPRPGARMSIRLGNQRAEADLSERSPQVHIVAIGAEPSPVRIETDQPQQYDPARGWHRIDLDRLRPQIPGGRRNDAIDRLPFILHNPSDQPQVARLLFAKSSFRHRVGVPITGISAMLRRSDGQPTGIPVQLSKNWHRSHEAGSHQGQWFHGFSHIRLAPNSRIELELTLAYGHWGGVAAASHAQLSLVGWGSNQLWEQSAIGAWGESICYEPDRIQGRANILDVRPLMVRNPRNNRHWGWTGNVGGGDFVRIFTGGDKRLLHRNVRPSYQRQGPCLTEVTYSSQVASSLDSRATVSLARSDDLVRGIYKLDLQVREALDFSRAVLFQLGSDHYNYNREAHIAVGDTNALRSHWQRNKKVAPLQLQGESPWVALTQATAKDDYAPANRGLVIRHWEAVLGGKPAAPWMVDSGCVDLVPPPDCKRLLPGDYLRATLEHIVIPQHAEDYYGPNAELLAALAVFADDWRMVHREAAGNSREIDLKQGTLLQRLPDVRVQVVDDQASYTFTGGIGYVPLTFAGLSTPFGGVLSVDGNPVDQSVHGNDFWQTDYDPHTNTWSRSYTVKLGPKPRRVLFDMR